MRQHGIGATSGVNPVDSFERVDERDLLAVSGEVPVA